MKIMAKVNTPLQLGNRMYTGRRTKNKYGIVNHGRTLAVETVDIARDADTWVNPETGLPFLVREDGGAIDIRGLTIVDDGRPAILPNYENEALLLSLRKRVARRNELLQESRDRTVTAHALEAEAYGTGRNVRQPESQLPTPVSPPIDTTHEELHRLIIADLLAIDGVGEATAEKLYGYNVQGASDLATLTDDDLLELEINKANLPQVRAWLDKNIEVVQDD